MGRFKKLYKSSRKRCLYGSACRLQQILCSGHCLSKLLSDSGLALLLNKKFKGNELLTTLIVLPMMLSPAVVGTFWTYLYNPQVGVFSYIMNFFYNFGPIDMIGSQCSCSLVNCYCRYLDVDTVYYVNLSCWS